MAKKNRKSKFDFNSNVRLMIAAFKLLSTDDEFLTNYRPILDPKHWEQPELRWLVENLVREFDRVREAPGTRILKMRLDREVKDEDQHKLLLTFIEKMEDFKATDNEADFVYTEFEGFIQQRAMRYHLRKAMDISEDGDIDKAIETVVEARHVRLTDDDDWIVLPDSMPEYFNDFDSEELERISVPLGLPALDKKLQGGVRPGELAVWLAPTGWGKSMALVQNGAEAFRKGLVTVHFTLENSKEETRARYTHNLLQMDSEFLRAAGREDSGFDEAYEALKERYDGSIYIKHLVGSRTNVNDLDSYLTRLRDKGKPPGLIVVDYGDKMMPIHRSDRKYDDMASVFDELKDLAVIHECPVWTATQANRRGWTAKRVSLEHTSDSTGKVNNADVVISIGLDEKDRAGVELKAGDDEEELLYATTTRVLSLLKIRRAENRGWWTKVDAVLSQSRFAEIEGENWDDADDDEITQKVAQSQAKKQAQSKGHSRRIKGSDDDASE